MIITYKSLNKVIVASQPIGSIYYIFDAGIGTKYSKRIYSDEKELVVYLNRLVGGITRYERGHYNKKIKR